MIGAVNRRLQVSARAATLASLGLTSAFCVALLVARVAYNQDRSVSFLAWNLFLAWIPLCVALAIYDRGRGRSGPVAGALGALWLLFFPNAPYIVTDLIHLTPDAKVPLWYDAVMFSAFAWTGLLLGFVSLYLVHTVARRLLGPLRSWLLVLAALAVSSFGIYLGREERWNSWGLFVHPGRLLGDVAHKLAHPLAYPQMVGITVLFTGFLTLGYVVLYNFVRLGRQPEG